VHSQDAREQIDSSVQVCLVLGARINRIDALSDH